MNVRTWTALALAAALTLSLAGCGKKETEDSGDGGDAPEGPNSSLGLTLGYAEGLTVVDDPDALQKAVDAAFSSAAQEGLDMEYKDQAYSDDGQTFTCYLANAATNTKDLFIAVYGDAALNDELYLSQLIPPGMSLKTLTLNHPILPGTHPLFVVFTQVETDEDGELAIYNQTTVAVNFIVNQ